MIWHMRLAQMPFNRLIMMAHARDLPKKFSRCQILKYHTCMCGKTIKISWRLKGNSIEKKRPSHLPRECVTIDQMGSTTPGLISQLKGKPIIFRYR
jgi:hypothetical protein